MAGCVDGAGETAGAGVVEAGAFAAGATTFATTAGCAGAMGAALEDFGGLGALTAAVCAIGTDNERTSSNSHARENMPK